MGKSLVEAEALETARELMAKGGDIIQLPVDLVVAGGPLPPMPPTMW